MTARDIRKEFERYTLEHYETEYADRHLLHGAIRKWARETPDQIAIQEFNTGREFTYREFFERSTALALRLLQMGFEKGDFLAVMLPLTAEHIFLEYACFQIGVIHAPIDLRLKAAEVVRSLEMVEAKGFVFLGKTPAIDFDEIGKAVQENCPFVSHFIQFAEPEATIEGVYSAATLAAEASALLQSESESEEPTELGRRLQSALDAVMPTDGAQVIYTTGSTGLPKPALLSHRNITAQNMCLAAGFDYLQSTRMLVNLPPSHVGCQGEQLMTTFFGGKTAVILHMFDAEQTLQAIDKYDVEVFGQIPAMFNMQWRLPNISEYRLKSIQHALFGGQQVPREFVELLLNHYPLVGTGLGLSEMAGFVTYTGMTNDLNVLSDTLGWWMPITPLTIREPMREDGSAGREMPIGETGEICFSGPQVFIDYVNNPEAYAKTVSSDGICYTGDLGSIGENGLVFAGRSKLVIKPKGYQIHPAQVEGHFSQLKDQIAICGAVGAEHKVFSEGVVLFVELKPEAELTREQLDQHAKGIASFMRPLHYVLLEPGTFPLNRMAKTDYVKLSELAALESKQLREQGGWDC